MIKKTKSSRTNMIRKYLCDSVEWTLYTWAQPCCLVRKCLVDFHVTTRVTCLCRQQVTHLGLPAVHGMQTSMKSKEFCNDLFDYHNVVNFDLVILMIVVDKLCFVLRCFDLLNLWMCDYVFICLVDSYDISDESFKDNFFKCQLWTWNALILKGSCN